MKILLTGGLGFIGSHTAVELLEGGHDVVIADNLSNSKIEVIDKIKAIIQKLNGVTAWAEPVKRGRFTYDEKAFYQFWLIECLFLFANISCH